MTPILEIQKLSHIYSPDTPFEHAALSNVDLTISRGEFVGLIGHTGSGKSTLVQHMNGLLKPTSGHVLFDGRDIWEDPKFTRQIRFHVGLVMQYPEYQLFEETVYRDIAFGPTNMGLSKDEIDRRVREAAEVLDITQFLDRKPKALSGGQRQRVAIGRAIVRSPKVLLMDEPLSNLDAKLRNQMRAEIIKLREKIDTTFIYVTHDQVEAMTLGDRIVIMRDGYIQQIGTPQEVFNHPANLFVAGFIGTPQMNFFNARLEKKGGDYSVEYAGASFPLDGEMSAKLAGKGQQSADVILGVRPEHIAVQKDPSASAIEASIEVSELMGSELHLHLAANGQDVVAVIPTANIDPMAYARHTAVKFGFDAKLVCLLYTSPSPRDS